ncbi:hypothetical protein TSAR_005838 [Trichomalopsis sarcophagae]|uniref:Diuretic hormone receptor n=1 Tax=Trichomalopsis sarcophagae TaxID=543379 RepID=A0A232F1M0_9HYME|nr:hypothetical protein TSAR_005838 [Trichomalopsis sarcophagae]
MDFAIVRDAWKGRENATRWCWPNGTWNGYTNYTQCKELYVPELPIDSSGVELTTNLYLVGYGLSLSTLIIAVVIYLYYRELRCVRNIIHTNLMFTYILANFLWILMIVSQVSLDRNIPMCIIFYSMYHYFQLTNYFWMFVEGLYLYVLVVKTFSGDIIKLKTCLFIGWGIPLIVVFIWGMVRALAENSTEAESANEALSNHCPWMIPNPYDWLYQVPAILVLCVNVIFLFMIMWVLITKLRSANTPETQQYRKAAKALLVLIPLLGITYILMIAGPTEGQIANVFANSRAVLLSSQGLLVAMFYCFLNSEVRNAVWHHYQRWLAERSLGQHPRYYAQYTPRSRTESIRFCSHPGAPGTGSSLGPDGCANHKHYDNQENSIHEHSSIVHTIEIHQEPRRMMSDSNCITTVVAVHEEPTAASAAATTYCEPGRSC